ncbi:MAG: type II toxin-antitoxin system Phd/YefM family antitoxin [Actinomycetes bacterium]
MPIGIRELRADLAAHVRRAAGGEPTVVSGAGRPAAALVPLSAMRDGGDGGDGGETHLASLVASGALVPPRRSDGRVPDRVVAVWGNVRLDRLLREVRG